MEISLEMFFQHTRSRFEVGVEACAEVEQEPENLLGINSLFKGLGTVLPPKAIPQQWLLYIPMGANTSERVKNSAGWLSLTGVRSWTDSSQLFQENLMAV